MALTAPSALFALAPPAPAAAAPQVSGPAGLVWTSELAVGGGSGQVIANGADVVFPGQGRFDVTLPAREGRNSIEAVLVGGEGPGTRPETLAFRLRGRPGERATFAFDTTP